MNLKILIADDSPTNRKQLETVVRHLGHVPILACDGQEAVDKFRDESPDLVFMDVMMPGMDGMTAVKHIRAMQGSKWSPIVFFSALDRMQDMVRGLEEGGDDYVVKPASLQLLRAKINGYARLLSLQKMNYQYTEELENWRDEARTQVRLGAHVMARLTDADGLRDSLVRYFNIPTDAFSGDLLCARRAPDEVLHVMLADAAGHGLSAALAALPITQIFYSMTAKGFPIASIAEELNRRLKAILPADLFVAATLAAVDVRSQTVEVWNGGNPDALFMNTAGEITMRWPSRHPPLGILPEAVFSGLTETIGFHEPGDLVMCSDGLVEAEDPADVWFGLEGVARVFAQTPHTEGQRFVALRTAVLDHMAERPNRDDLSCMMVSLPVERRQAVRFSAKSAAVYQGPVSDWRLELSYGETELRYLDVVPHVLGFISQVQILKAHQGALFLILTELFNNALDHGLLGLDSSIKSSENGFELFLQERAQRLAQLQDGRIELSFLLHQDGNQSLLDLSVTDTGPGFDFQGTLAAELQEDNDHRPYGRGLRLLRNLCAELRYYGMGNKVWARYVLSEACVAADSALPESAPA
ncbi:MAG: fused response regulator/phosphatase [Betaproteobacteria bacterium]|nr:fused response regulator/phosphatase [Betaproteobacteria bacterium]